MRKSFLTALFLLVAIASLHAQRYDLGLWLGGANYFGDLNTHTSFRFVNPAGGLFARLNFDERVSVRTTLSAGHVWADDAYSHVYYERTRNLGFGSNIYEASVQFEFNFMPFSNVASNSVDMKHRYSPYVLAGFGAFHFNPTAILDGNKIDLQPLGTEGQGYPEYPSLKKYKRTSTAFLIGGGIKFRLTKNLGTQVEAAVRKTFTDYLDDVSGVYADPVILAHEGGADVAFLADPSVEVLNEPVGVPGKMRGDNSKSDDYLFFGVSLVYTIKPYKCPFVK